MSAPLLALLIALAAPKPETPVALEGAGQMKRFFAALRALEAEPDAGRVRVLHLGDSHIAADMLTGKMRSGLQTRFGDGGRGFVIPGKPWPSFWQAQVVTGSEGRWRTDGLPGGLDDGQVGPGGCTVASGDPEAVVSVGTAARADVSRTFSVLDVYYLRQPAGTCFDVRVDGATVGVVPTRGPWIEPAFARFDLPPGPHRVEIRPGGGAETRVLGVSMENASGVVYDALGINGAHAERLLRADPQGMAAILERMNPNLIVFSYGTNEAFDRHFDPEKYRLALDRVVSRLRAMAPRADCLLTGPGDFLMGRRTPPGLDSLVQLQRDAARVHGCAFWDQRAAMGGPGSIRRWRRAGLAQGDFVHLTRAGYERVGEKLFVALVDAYEGRQR